VWRSCGDLRHLYLRHRCRQRARATAIPVWQDTMEDVTEHFFPGEPLPPRGALARYLDPWPRGVVTACVKALGATGGLFIDPFCFSAVPVREALEAGCWVVASDNNPLLPLAVRAQLVPPDPTVLREAASRLALAPKLRVTLEEHLQGLYQAVCPACAAPVIADYFIWDREEKKPVEKFTSCPRCGVSGLAAVVPEDLEGPGKVEARGLHYWYMLDRVAPPGDPGREAAEGLMALYTPRNLSALADLVMKAEALFAGSTVQEPIRLVLLSCFDACSSLNSPDAAGRPRRLHPPARFVERNVWQIFNKAIEELLVPSTLPAPACTRPVPEAQRRVEVPGTLSDRLEDLAVMRAGPRGETSAWVGACSVRALGEQLPEGCAALILTAPPRPDVTFWALAYLWSGWLLGHEAAASLRPLLGRPPGRFLRGGWPDWSWYQGVMTVALRSLAPLLGADARLLLRVVGEEPRRVESLLLSVAGAGLRTREVLYQRGRVAGEDEYQLVVVKGGGGPLPHPAEIEALGATLVRMVRERGEPAPWAWLHAVACRSLATTGSLGRQQGAETGLPRAANMAEMADMLAQVTAAGQRAGLAQLGVEEEVGEEAAWYWLREPQRAGIPLGDRIERVVEEILRENLVVTTEEAVRAACARLPGPLTPDAGFVEACLAAYGEEVSPGCWRLGPGEEAESREAGRKETGDGLMTLGQHLGYQVRAGGPEGFDVVWEEDARLAGLFLVVSRVTIAPLLPEWQEEQWQVPLYLLTPAARTPLWVWRLKSYPWLGRQVARRRWTFIKWEHLATLLKRRKLGPHDLKTIMGLSPIVEKGEAQIPLF
jgi:hypothetical protein